MHNAQIWKSIEALCNEAETVSQSGVPIVAVIKSTPQPIASQRFNAPTPTAIVVQNETVILTANPAPPTVVLEVRSDVDDRDQTAPDSNSPLTPSTMADIAAAIEQISKAPKDQKASLKDQITSDTTRKQMIGEISEAVRIILADELPKLVHKAVSSSLNELLTTPTTHTMAHGELGATKQEPVIVNQHALKKATEKKSSLKKTISKKLTVKKPPVTKAELPTSTAKKGASKNATKKRQ